MNGGVHSANETFFCINFGEFGSEKTEFDIDVFRSKVSKSECLKPLKFKMKCRRRLNGSDV